MTEPTTLQRCATFLEKHGMSEELVYDEPAGKWTLHGLYDYMTVSDGIVTTIIKERLWEIIKKAHGYVEWHPRTEMLGCISQPWLIVGDLHPESRKEYTGPDELALLLAAAQEVMG